MHSRSRAPIVVIDPGHGGEHDLRGFSPNNATGVDSGELEKALTLDIGLRVRTALLADTDHPVEVHLTRTTDVNVGIAARPRVARDNGADIFVSIHFNAAPGGNTEPRGVVAFVRSRGRNSNYSEDEQLAQRLVDGVAGVIPGSDGNRGVRPDNNSNHSGLGVLVDSRLGNSGPFHPNRSCLLEVEFLTNPTVDALFNNDPNQEVLRTNVANAIAEAIINDLLNQP